MNQELYDYYQAYKQKTNAYALALSTMSFDQATIAPKNGTSYSNQLMAVLSTEAFIHASNPESIKKIEQLANEDIDDLLKKELSLLLKELHDNKDVPTDVFSEFTLATNEAGTAWSDAIDNQDYITFIPYLERVINAVKKQLKYHPNKKECAYNILLDRFEPGMNMDKYDAFFEQVKESLIPLIHQIIDADKKIDESILNQSFDIKSQEVFMNELCEYMRVNRDECYISTTQHPFTSFFSGNDVRITTHYYEKNLLSAIFSTIHEYGHALFGLQIDDAFEGTSLSNAIGFAMHESQSRFLENHIGKSKAFWEPNLAKLKANFPSLESLDIDTFMELVNVSKPSLVRTEADELTYPLHVIIRYELEKEMFENETIDYLQLNEKWNQKYKEYLGVTPSHDGEGILQDMHWSSAYFGYFPTYALGSAYAAQFYHTMSQRLDVDSILKNNEFEKIATWLKDNIHHHGASKTTEEILFEVTHEEFNPMYYITYLQDKFKTLYKL